MKQLRSLKVIIIFVIAFFLIIYLRTATALINVIAAENVYGEVAKELGGPYVNVISIINSPSSDPHLFTTSPSTGKAVNKADVIIYNGADYDPWMKSILAIEGQPNREIIDIASLLHIKSGANPHLWYLPDAMPTFANIFVTTLSERDPQHKAYYQDQLANFNASYQIIFKKIAELKNRFQHSSVIATEPVFGYMAQSIGLQMHGEAFQISMMNDVPPTISQIKQFTDDLQHHTVKVLIYNNQVINPLTEHLRALAEKEGIPVVGVGEMLPNNITYVQWMENQLTALEKALEQSTRK